MDMESDLDALLRDLSSAAGPAPVPARAPAPAARPAPAQPARSAASQVAQPVKVAPPSINRGAAQQRAPAPVKKTDELDELAALMEDLTSTANTASVTPAPAPAPASAPAPAPALPARQVTTLKPANQQAPVASSSSPVAHVTASRPAPTVKAVQSPPAVVDTGGVVEDLDALMQSLSAAADAAPRSTPATKLAAQPAVKPAPSIQRPAVQTKSTTATAPAPANAKPIAPSSTDADPLDDLLNSLTPLAEAQPKPAIPAAKPQPTAQPAAQPRVTQPPAQPRVTQPTLITRKADALEGGDELDKLLDNLTTQATEDPILADRGNCATCNMPISGEIIQALGKSYHPEHFVCGNCKTPLGTSTFFERNGQPHCERCFKSLLCPRCAHCDEPIIDRCITALGKKWHSHHFICATCLKPFENGSFFEKDGKAYCEQDFYALFSARCASCDQAIRGDFINALGVKWHPDHFVCQYCHKPFANGAFFEFKGKPYCELHYHQVSGTGCASCGKPVSGKVINALGKKWHPEHFICAFCMGMLTGGSFKEDNGKPYCTDCYHKLFA